MPKCSAHGCVFSSPKKYFPRHNDLNPPDKPNVYTIPKMSAKKKAAQPKIKAEKKELGKFYLEMLAVAPKKCMECGCNLRESMVINPRAVVCHILPKRTFKSIAQHPDNIVYLCNKHHNELDNFSPVKMKIFPLLIERVTMLLPLIKQEELKSIPEYYLK